MIIGRTKEIELLRTTLKSEYSSFVAVYGRRRIGKTFLVREAFDYSFTFQHAGLFKGTKAQQLNGFMSSLADAGFKSTSTPKNWMQAFDLLKEHIKQSRRKKKILFIDELSWMETPKSDLMMALEFFWNSWASARKDIVLIVCASATSWMLNKVIHNKGGLYNRLNLRLHLKPFSLNECRQIVQANNIPFSLNQIAEYYMIMGGIPYYWTLLNRSKSLPQNVDALIFEEDAPLKNEYDYLFTSIFNSPEPYIKIIEALTQKKYGLTRNEILETTGLTSSGNLTKLLKDLESSGFIRKYFTFGKRSSDAIYQLIDNFVIFHYHFLKGRTNSDGLWAKTYNTPKINAWKGLAFERLCISHVQQIKAAIGIAALETSEYAWSCQPKEGQPAKGAQIDLIINRGDSTITICEMKYYNKEVIVDKEMEESLRIKINDFVEVSHTKNAIHLTLITTYGLVPNIHSDMINSVVTLPDLFK